MVTRPAAAGHRAGFTLIELLIVVAIIAILAAIAVPNFLEAQVRAKVSRTSTDMRSIRVGIESYRVDNNTYPDTDFGGENLTQYGVGLIRITTPISYFSSVPKSPFSEEKIGNAGVPQNAVKFKWYLYVRAALPTGSPALPAGVGAPTDGGIVDEKDINYNNDRIAYMGNGDLAANLAERSKGDWMLKSVGPNNEDDRSSLNTNARVYDPTNGTVSPGDVVTFSDVSGLAKRN